ncbi:MAG: TIR domain-containing protein [Sphingomonadaceae bacterium]|nr:TIR domain-containing protein [Sphingomonadaceae bacterium]
MATRTRPRPPGSAAGSKPIASHAAWPAASRRAVRAALVQSGALIILCSPHAAASLWVAEEVETFRRLHPDARSSPRSSTATSRLLPQGAPRVRRGRHLA